MKFNKKIGKINFPYTIGSLDDENTEYATINIKSDVHTDTRYSDNVECYILTVKELIQKEASTLVECYFEELITKMEVVENSWNISKDDSLINTLLGLDRTDYTKNGGYDKLLKRAKKYTKANLAMIINNNCLEVRNEFCHNKLYFYVL